MVEMRRDEMTTPEERFAKSLEAATGQMLIGQQRESNRWTLRPPRKCVTYLFSSPGFQESGGKIWKTDCEDRSESNVSNLLPHFILTFILSTFEKLFWKRWTKLGVQDQLRNISFFQLKINLFGRFKKKKRGSQIKKHERREDEND